MSRLLFVALSMVFVTGCGAPGSPAVTPTTRPTTTPSSEPTATPTATPTSAPTQSPVARVAIMIPLYIYPGAAWEHVIQVKQQHPRVPFIIIANPSSGPGTLPDASYTAYIAKARNAGIDVAGYVATGYATRSWADVRTDIDRYVQWYHVDGIFLDEMADGYTAYYQGLTIYAHSLALHPVILNPGVPVSSAAGADAVVAYESPGYPSASVFAALSPPVVRWGYIAGAVPFDPGRIAATLPYVGFLYATDGAEPECYCILPSYFDALVSMLDQ